ncbi:MAG: lipoyl synthase [Candidatus Micrarchaeota archaeon]
MGKPPWLRIRHIENAGSAEVAGLMKGLSLHSVCQSAHCPNRSECWANKTASFMVMGEFCTRACRFCAVKTMGKPPSLDPNEPKNLAEAVASLGLRYVVVTCVTRDDLPDGGAEHLARCVRELKAKMPELIVETLVPDFFARGEAIRVVAGSGVDVVSHNIETIERLSSRVRDRRANYRQSLETLRLFRELSGGKIITKSGIMAGLGERGDEVEMAMKDLLAVGVEILTVGQYLSPGKAPRHLPVEEYVAPDRFAGYEKMAYSLGFAYVASGPFVRSSYRAAEPFINGSLRSRAGSP